MSRTALILSLLAVLGVMNHAWADHAPARKSRCCCAAPSVYPACCHDTRRLPGQWWDDAVRYPTAGPAHHEYGEVDHGDKPWSLIPGDGYVGAPDPADTAPAPREQAEPKPGPAEQPKGAGTPEAAAKAKSARKPKSAKRPQARPDAKSKARANKPAPQRKKETRKRRPTQPKPRTRARSDDKKQAPPTTRPRPKRSRVEADRNKRQKSESKPKARAADRADKEASFAGRRGIPWFLFITLAAVGHCVRRAWRRSVEDHGLVRI